MVIDPRPAVDTVNRVEEVDCLLVRLGGKRAVTPLLNYRIGRNTAVFWSEEAGNRWPCRGWASTPFAVLF